MDHLLYHLLEQVNPQLAIVIGQSYYSSKNVLAFFLHCYYEWSKWCYFILKVVYDLSPLTMTYSMAPFHSLVDGLRINQCHQKEDITSRPQYLTPQIHPTTWETPSMDALDRFIHVISYSRAMYVRTAYSHHSVNKGKVHTFPLFVIYKITAS